MSEGRSRSFYVLSFLFGVYALFLYGPTITIVVLSFQAVRMRKPLYQLSRRNANTNVA